MSTLPNNQMEVIERYLLKQLSDEERNEFEASILEDAELFEEVQKQEAFIAALRNEKTTLTTKRPTENVLNLAQWIRQPFSMAASLGLAVSLTLFLGTNSDTGFSTAVATNLLIEATRGPESTIESSGTEPILVTVDVGPDDGSSRFSIQIIENSTNADVFSLDNLKIDDQGWLRVFVNQSFSGEHAIHISRTVNGSSESISTQQVRFLP